MSLKCLIDNGSFVLSYRVYTRPNQHTVEILEYESPNSFIPSGVWEISHCTFDGVWAKVLEYHGQRVLNAKRQSILKRMQLSRYYVDGEVVNGRF